jgi:hypothetical protein
MESVDSFTLRLLIQQIDENVEYGFPINDWLMRIYNLVKSRDAYDCTLSEDIIKLMTRQQLSGCQLRRKMLEIENTDAIKNFYFDESIPTMLLGTTTGDEIEVKLNYFNLVKKESELIDYFWKIPCPEIPKQITKMFEEFERYVDEINSRLDSRPLTDQEEAKLFWSIRFLHSYFEIKLNAAFKAYINVCRDNNNAFSWNADNAIYFNELQRFAADASEIGKYVTASLQDLSGL